jgi:hypothetical protein
MGTNDSGYESVLTLEEQNDTVMHILETQLVSVYINRYSKEKSFLFNSVKWKTQIICIIGEEDFFKKLLIKSYYIGIII